MIAIRPFTAAWAMACASLSWAGTPALVELGRHVPGFSFAGPALFAIADFDGDGLDDIVVPAQSGTSLFQVFGHGATGIVSKQAVFLPDVALEAALVATVDGQPQLVTVSQGGMVRRFTGWPLVEVHSFDVGAHPIVSAAVADIDNDGELDLVTSSAYEGYVLHAHVLLDGQWRWSLAGIGGRDMLPGQFDADPALEIVLAGTPGRVIDGATHATDWFHADGFRSFIVGGRFQASGGNQFLAAWENGGIVAFQSAPWLSIWDLETLHVTALAVADLDDDGIDDIIEAESGSMDVNIIDGGTRTVRLSIPYQASKMSAIAAWDHDGDGESDVAFSVGASNGLPPALVRLADAKNGSTLWEYSDGQLPSYQRLAMSASGSGYSLVHPFATQSVDGGWAQMDAMDGHAQWRTPPAYAEGPFTFVVPKDTTFTRRGSGLVLAGGHASAGARFIGLDAQSHAVLWVLDGTTEPALLNRGVLDVTELEIGGDSKIAACLIEGAGKRLALIDAATGTLSWNSVVMESSTGGCGVLTGRFSDGANPLVVAVLRTSLRAFDSTTHALAWTLPGPVDGASVVEGGVAGREFVVFEGSQLRFHDAGTRALLRSFDLGMPVGAVKQVNGDIHGLLVAAGGHLLLVDGANGTVVQSSGYLGHDLGKGNRIATVDLGGGYTLIGIGSEGGVFRYRLYTGDGIFTDGFETSVD